MAKCKICVRDDRQDIDDALRENRDSLRSLAAHFGVSKDGIRRHRAHLEEPRQATESGQDVLPRQLTQPQSATLEPESRADRYRAFVARFSGGRAFSMAEVRSWDYEPEELEVFIETAVECGDLSRRSEPRQ